MRARISPQAAGVILCVFVLALLAPAVLPARAAPTAADHLVTNITLTPLSPNVLKLGQDVSLTFDYQTVEPGGVRIFARPYTDGALSPDYSASGSIVHPTGAGAATGSFTLNTPAVVDHIRLRMVNADQSEVLFEAFIPVHYEYADPEHILSDVQLTPGNPNVLKFGTDLDVTMNYTTSWPGGVLIFARPFTDGALSPGYSADGSPVHPTGSGAATNGFTFAANPVTVDEIRLTMTNSDQTILLFETLIPVHYLFGDPEHIITDVTLSPPNPNIMDHNQDVVVNFNYTTSWPGGVRIFTRPVSNGDLSPNYAASGAPLLPTGSGASAGSFTITSGPVVVDHIRFRMTNADQTVLLYETTVPVYYQYGTVKKVFLPLMVEAAD